MVRERSRVLGRKCSFSLVEMITESINAPRVVTKETYENMKKISLSPTLSISSGQTLDQDLVTGTIFVEIIFETPSVISLTS